MESNKVLFRSSNGEPSQVPVLGLWILDCERKTQIRVSFLFRQRKERLVKFGDVEMFIFVWVSCSFIFKTTDRPSKNDRSGTWVREVNGKQKFCI